MAMLAPAVGTPAAPQTPPPAPVAAIALSVGVLPNAFPPFSILQNGRLAGVAADTLSAALGDAEVRLEPRVYPDAAALLAAACAHEIDLVVDFPESAELRRCLRFSSPYFDGDAVTFARVGGLAYSADALSAQGVRLAVRRGTLLEKELRSRYPQATLVRVKNVAEGLAAVADGRADFYTALRPVADYLLASAPVAGIVEVSSYREPDGALRFGFSARAEHLLAPLNEGLASLSADRRKAILGKWTRPSLAAPNEAPSTFYLTPQERAYLATLPPLRVAFDANLPPYAYLDDSGRPSGIAWSYLTWLSKALGIQFQRIPTNGLATTADALRAGKIDMASVAAAGNPLWEGLSVSHPYATFPVAIFGRQDAAPIDGFSELAGKRIATSRISGLQSKLRERIPGATWIVEETVQQALNKVSTEQADVYLGGLASGDIVLQHDFIGQLRVIGSTGTQLSFGFALTPSLAGRLGPIIDRAIASLPEEQKLDIQHRYVVAGYEFGPSFKTLLVQFGPAFAGLLVVIVVLTWLLMMYRKELRLRRGAESELSSQLEFQRVLIDAFPIPMVVRDPHGRYEVANIAVEKLTGRPRADLLGKTSSEVGFWSDDNIRRIDEGCDYVLRTGEPYSRALSHVGADGQVRHFLSRIHPFGLKGGGNVGVICISDDVTEIRQAEFRAQQAQLRLARLTRHLPVMVFQGKIGPANELIVLWVSGNAEAVFGVSPEQLMRTPESPNKYIHPDDRLTVLAAAEHAQNAHEPLICDVRVRHAALWRWTRVHAIASLEPDGQTVWNGYWMDTAAEREQFDLLSRARDNAEMALRAKDRFLALMSHEIRTPMSGVLGLVELLTHTTLNQEQAAMVGMIEDSASTLMQILNDILDYSKIEADKVELEVLPVDIRELCDVALGLLAVSAHEKGLQMRLEVSDEVAAVVAGDGLRLRQILFNLLSNAIKFTARGVVSLLVDVAAHDAGTQTIVWTVSDTGIGIPQNLQDKLFEPFFQADASTTRRFGGTGLGLSICHQLVQLMHGTITVSSVPGQGTRFSVSVPLPVKESVYAQPPLQGVRAAVCLRDAASARALAGLLRAAGAHADVRSAADVATTAAATGTDLVFLDDGEALPSAQPSCAVIHTTLNVKPSGFRLTDEDIRLSTNPLTWHGTREVALAALGRRSAATLQAGPAVPAKPPAGLPGATAGKPATQRDEALARRQLILIAEDHATNRLLLQRQLGQLGYASDAVADGNEAWQALGRTDYALLITDCHMPGLSGYELATRIRAQERAHGASRLPIIAITANAGVEEVKRCLDAGMDITLFKPVQLQALRDCIPRYLA